MRYNINLSIPAQDEYLVDEVILPLKGGKRLSSVIVALLKSYQEDSYVNGVIEGTVLEDEIDTQKALRDKLSNIGAAFAKSDMVLGDMLTMADNAIEDISTEAGNSGSTSTAELENRIDNIESKLDRILNLLGNGVVRVDTGSVDTEDVDAETNTDTETGVVAETDYDPVFAAKGTDEEEPRSSTADSTETAPELTIPKDEDYVDDVDEESFDKLLSTMGGGSF